MSRKQTLIRLRSELEQIDAQLWPDVKTWAAKAKVTIRSDWPDMLSDFEDLLKEPAWLMLPRVGGPRQGHSSYNSDAAATERNINKSKAADAKKGLLSFLGALIEREDSRTDSNKGFDVLLITVNQYEYDAVKRLAIDRSGIDPPVMFGKRAYYDLGKIGGVRVAVVRSEMGSTQPGGSTITTLQAITDLAARYVIAVGVMFGTDRSKQKIGQILYSRQLQNYDLQRIGTEKDFDSTIIPRGDKVTANPRFLSIVRDAADNWPEAAAIGVPEGVLLLSGEKLVDNLDYRNQLLQLFPEAKGGEMEATGMYAAAREEETHWMVIKAVCDYADGKKGRGKKANQVLAANNAAQFVFFVLERGGL
jgi:nucleoside phosphorylase